MATRLNTRTNSTETIIFSSNLLEQQITNPWNNYSEKDRKKSVTRPFANVPQSLYCKNRHSIYNCGEFLKLHDQARNNLARKLTCTETVYANVFSLMTANQFTNIGYATNDITLYYTLIEIQSIRKIFFFQT